MPKYLFQQSILDVEAGFKSEIKRPRHPQTPSICAYTGQAMIAIATNCSKLAI